MVFNSIQFLIFLPVVFILYWLLPHKYRWILLVSANYFFYLCWNPKYVLLLLFITAVTYYGAIFIEKNETSKKAILSASIVLCVGLLAVFKYLNFILETISKFLLLFSVSFQPALLKIVMPIGISFYTFQTIGYVIDVYRGRLSAEQHFGKYAAFISFFPLLGSGPIERAKNILPQINEERIFDYDSARDGLLLMAWGYFKKVAIANTLAIYSDKIYNNVLNRSGFCLIVASLFYTIQIYCDFSGYSDIAIGTSRLLGFKIIDNFKSPYFSQSIKEFWSRWHISLSSWFRDYVYIPLGGNRVSPLRHKINLMITFLVSGLWHGADLTFIVWGALHGFAQVLEAIFINTPPRYKKFKYLNMIIVFCFVSFAWIFFRASSFQEVFHILTHLFTGINNPVQYLYKGYRNIYMPVSLIIRCSIMILILAVHDYLALNHNISLAIKKLPVIVRWGIYLAFIWMIIAFMPIGADQEFIYFQF